MPSTINGDIVQVTFVGQQGEQNGLMVTHWLAGNVVGNGASDAEIATAMDTKFQPLLRALMNANSVYRGVFVQFRRQELTDKAIVSPGSLPGLVAGTALASQTAGVLSLRTGVASRTKRGRKYVFFPSSTDSLPGGAPTNTYLTNLQALANGFLTPVSAGAAGNTCELVFCVFSRKNQTMTPVTQILRRTQWGTQRRRSRINRGDVPLP